MFLILVVVPVTVHFRSVITACVVRC